MHVLITGYHTKNNVSNDIIKNIINNIFSQKKFKKYITTYKIIQIDDIFLPENLFNCDRIIFFGGTINNYFLDKLIKLHKIRSNIKFSAIGVNCNQDYKTLINKINIFENIVFINKKDFTNLSLYVQSNLNQDVLFLNKINNKNIIKKIFSKNIIGFFLSQILINQFSQDKIKKFIKFIIYSIKFFININYKIYLFSVYTNDNTNNYDDDCDDDILNKKLLNFLNDNEKQHVKIYSNKKILSKMHLLKFGICLNFYSHILCTIYKIPFISLSNTDDVTYFLNENNLTDLSCDIDNYVDKINFLINNENLIKNKLKVTYKFNLKESKKYLDPFYYFINKKENVFYIDKKKYEYIYIKLKEFYNKYKSNNSIFNAKIITFFLIRSIENEYIYSLEQKIFKGIDKLKEDIYSLINDCIIKKNLLFYESVSEILNKNNKNLNININESINIKYINQNDYNNFNRSGLQYIINNLSDLHSSDGILCDLNLDKTFHWNYNDYEKLNIIPYKKNWIGFIHTYDNNLFKKELFIESLKFCHGLFVFSNYLKIQIENILKQYNLNIKVYTLINPTEFVTDEFMFTPRKFTMAIKKKIIQIGVWMRDINAINNLNIDNTPLFLDKYVLIGKNMEELYYSSKVNESDNNITTKSLINNKYNTLKKVKLNNDINIINHLENIDYDKLLSESLVFIYLIDASSVNTVIECIVRNTPIFVNRLPALEEILGTDYPLFYNDIIDVTNLLTMDYIDKAYSYLKNLNKNKFKINYFISELKNIIKIINNNLIENDKNNSFV